MCTRQISPGFNCCPWSFGFSHFLEGLFVLMVENSFKHAMGFSDYALVTFKDFTDFLFYASVLFIWPSG